MSAKILLVVGGGIAAYKAPEIVRAFVKDGHEVQVVVTPAALAFVTELSLSTVSGRPVRSTVVDAAQEGAVGHIELADWPDVVVVAPATADLMARAAHGLANDLATTVLLATTAPVLWAPAMNTNMWRHAATVANVRLLADRGAQFVGPDRGELACGWVGEGRMIDPHMIAEAANSLLQGKAPPQAQLELPVSEPPQPPDTASPVALPEPDEDDASSGPTAPVLPASDDPISDQVAPVGPGGPWTGRTVLISAGPTRAYLDPVRFISNASTGAMGLAIARVARQLGAEVHLVAGPIEQVAPQGIHRYDVETAKQMFEAMHGVLTRTKVDLVAMVAAVADLVPEAPVTQKIDKEGLVDALATMKWRNEMDVLKTLVSLHGGSTKFLGFAAQTVESEDPVIVESDLLRYGEEKMKRKGTSALFVNRVGVQGLGFASSTNAGYLLLGREEGRPSIISSGQPMAKSKLARWLLELVGEEFWGGEA